MIGLNSLTRRFFGSANDRRLKPFLARVEAINALEPQFAALSDAELKRRQKRFAPS
jgi:preprotein translocase subunit SecA